MRHFPDVRVPSLARISKVRQDDELPPHDEGNAGTMHPYIAQQIIDARQHELRAEAENERRATVRNRLIGRSRDKATARHHGGARRRARAA